MNTAEIIGNLFVQILKLIGNAFLVVVLIVGKILIGTLKIITSWIEKSLNSKDH
jgi:hypothetical protein